MLRLHDYAPSGNGYKVRLLLTLLGTPFEWVEHDITKGETRTPDFLRVNPNGRIPVLELEDGSALAESNAILVYLAEGTRFLPEDRFERALVLQWLFFEQYSHEPNIATLRYWITHDLLDDERRPMVESKRRWGYAALDVMERHLGARRYVVGERYSIADIALYAYTHVAEEGAFDLARYGVVRRWLERVAAEPGHIPITQV
ncbi:MAG TPA: glutathione S-transferase family protein [Stellaceae bacterium]|nr:glutathione S-transferase family protein [Stellaceae bacterium]